ncbi:hypothetical protein [Bradyrhizobium japonicum]|uniref:hypothetical protein n=1 Tax=Bradyrhizobium japonicum TaxID=375 RepID=UPI00351323B7
MIIRPERPTDTMAIRTVVTAAFRDASRSDGNEAADIVDALRIDGTLAVLWSRKTMQVLLVTWLSRQLP